MDAIVLPQPDLVSRPKRRPYTSQEWDAKKEIITNLFENGKSHNYILLSLEDQFPNFRPTLPMLKRRVTKWGLGRNHNEAVVAEALRIAIQREAQSKKTAFIIGNKKVTRQEIDRYLRRKGITDAHSFAASSSRKGPTTVVPYTPSPTPPPPDPSCESTWMNPIVDLLSNYSESNDHTDLLIFSTAEARWTATGTHRLVAPVAGPPELDLLRKALMLNDAYYRSIHAFGTFTTSSITNLAKVDELLDSFTSGMWRGRDLLIEGEITSAFRCFDEAFDSINGITVQHSRRFLPELFEMFLNFQLEERFDILQSLLRFIAEISKVNGDRNGWLSTISICLLRTNQADRVDVVERLMRNALSHFETNVGEDHPETKSIVKALSRSIFRRKPVVQAIGHLQAILRDQQAVASMSKYETCNVLVELALCHRVQNRFDDSVDWAHQAWSQAEALDSLFHQTDIKVRCLRVTSYIEKKRGNWQTAHELSREAVKMSSLGLGSEDSLTALVQVELTDLQNQANAAGVQLFPFDSNNLTHSKDFPFVNASL